MLRFEAYRFELCPKGEQERNLHQFAGSERYVWKRALAIENIENEERGKTGRKQSSDAALCRELTGCRNHSETEWLRQSPLHPTQHVLGDLGISGLKAGEDVKA